MTRPSKLLSKHDRRYLRCTHNSAGIVPRKGSLQHPFIRASYVVCRGFGKVCSGFGPKFGVPQGIMICASLVTREGETEARPHYAETREP